MCPGTANPTNFHPNWAGLAVLFSIYQATSKRLPVFSFVLFFKYKTIETHASAFLPLNISAVGSVLLVSSKKLGGYFFNFWGLLTIYQLYSHKVSSKNHCTYNECLIQNRKVTDRQILNEIEKLNQSKFGFLGTLYESLNSNESKIDDNKWGLHKLIILSWLLSSTFSLFSELLSLYYDTFYTVNNCTT